MATTLRPRIRRAMRLDAALSRALRKAYGPRAGDMRYRPSLWVDPELVRLGRIHLRATLHAFPFRGN